MSEKIKCPFCSTNNDCKICNGVKKITRETWFFNAYGYPEVINFLKGKEGMKFQVLKDRKDALLSIFGGVDNPKTKTTLNELILTGEIVSFVRAETPDDYRNMMSENFAGIPDASLIFKSINDDRLLKVPMSEFASWVKEIKDDNNYISCKTFQKLPSWQNRPFAATAYICEQLRDKEGILHTLDLEVAFGAFKTVKRALEVSKSITKIIKNSNVMMVKCILPDDEISYYIHEARSNYIFYKIKEDKLKSMGEPIDSSTKKGREEIFNTLINRDEKYLIEIDDLIPIDYNIDDFVENFKEGYSFQHLAYGVIKYNGNFWESVDTKLNKDK